MLGFDAVLEKLAPALAKFGVRIKQVAMIGELACCDDPCDNERQKGAPKPGDLPWLTVLAGLIAAGAHVVLLLDYLG